MRTIETHRHFSDIARCWIVAIAVGVVEGPLTTIESSIRPQLPGLVKTVPVASATTPIMTWRACDLWRQFDSWVGAVDGVVHGS